MVLILEILEFKDSSERRKYFFGNIYGILRFKIYLLRYFLKAFPNFSLNNLFHVSLSKLEWTSWNILSDFKMENFGNIESKIGKYLHYQGD